MNIHGTHSEIQIVNIQSLQKLPNNLDGNFNLVLKQMIGMSCGQTMQFNRKFYHEWNSIKKLTIFQVHYFLTQGMFNLSRKNMLGRGLMKMRKRFPEEYAFFPLTWMLPVEYHELKSYFESKVKGKARTFIVKPEALSQGKGIFLTRKL